MTILVAFLFSCSKLAEFLHVVFNVIEKRVPEFLPLVFASLYKDAARKTEWFLHTQYPENEARFSAKTTGHC